MENAITTLHLFKMLSAWIGKEKAATPYMVAKVMGVNQTTARLWSLGVSVMDEENAEKAAAMLGLDLEYVIFSLEAERKRRAGLDKIAALFERAALVAANHGQAAIVGFLAVGLLPFLASAAGRLCILCKTGWPFFEASQAAARWRRPLSIRSTPLAAAYNSPEYPAPRRTRVIPRQDAPFWRVAVTQ